MNPMPDLDTTIAAWLEDGPTDLPDNTRRAITAALPTTTQRRRSSRAPWRFIQMSASLRTAIAVLVAAVVIGGGIYVLGTRDNGPGASPTPSPTPTSPIGSPSATPITMTPSIFETPLSITTPPNWIVLGDQTDWYAVGRQLGGGPLVAVEVLTFAGDVYADTCDPEMGVLDPPIEPGAARLAQFVLDVPSLHAFGVPSVEIDGHPAVGVEDAMVSDERCVGGAVLWPTAIGEPYVLFEEEHKQLYFLDVNGKVVVVGVVTTDSGWSTYLPDAMAVLETIRFR